VSSTSPSFSPRVIGWWKFIRAINVGPLRNKGCRLFAIHWLNPISFMTTAKTSESVLGWSGCNLHQMIYFQRHREGAVVNDYKCQLSCFQVSPDFISTSTLPNTECFSQRRDFVVPDYRVIVLCRNLFAFYIASWERSVDITNKLQHELNHSDFWIITRREVVWNRRFGATYRSHKMGSIYLPETSIVPSDGTDR
jgi:hypothetical protein